MIGLTNLSERVNAHFKTNYNEKYEFQNAECCVHLLRDLKIVVNNLNHECSKHMINLLLKENHNCYGGNYVDADIECRVFHRHKELP